MQFNIIIYFPYRSRAGETKRTLSDIVLSLAFRFIFLKNNLNLVFVFLFIQVARSQVEVFSTSGEST